MVDVMLVLLVIMMVSATYIVSRALKVELPKSASSDEPAQAPITVTLTKDGQTLVNQEPVVGDAALIAHLPEGAQRARRAEPRRERRRHGATTARSCTSSTSPSSKASPSSPSACKPSEAVEDDPSGRGLYGGSVAAPRRPLRHASCSFPSPSAPRRPPSSSPTSRRRRSRPKPPPPAAPAASQDKPKPPPPPPRAQAQAKAAPEATKAAAPPPHADERGWLRGSRRRRAGQRRRGRRRRRSRRPPARGPRRRAASGRRGAQDRDARRPCSSSPPAGRRRVHRARGAPEAQGAACRPKYTKEARQAEIEGVVRVEVTVDETRPRDRRARPQRPGYGLDEAALDAAKAMRLRAGHAVRQARRRDGDRRRSAVRAGMRRSRRCATPRSRASRPSPRRSRAAAQRAAA